MQHVTSVSKRTLETGYIVQDLSLDYRPDEKRSSLVETMASGKPTLTYIRDDLVSAYPKDLPIVVVNPDTIYSKLKELILSAELRHKIGAKSRAYTEKYHDVRVVVDNLETVYEKISRNV